MSRPIPAGPAADARATLDEHDQAAFDRLAGGVLASPSAPLGPLLRAQLPGTVGVRWLREEQLSPTSPPGTLTAAQWLSLFASWSSTQQAPTAGGRDMRRSGGRPSTHGHAGSGGRPRWGQ